MRSDLRLLLLGASSLLILACGSFGKTDDGDDDDDDDWFDDDSGNGDDTDPCADAAPLDENCDGEVDCDEDPTQAECDDTNTGSDTGVGLWYYVGVVGSDGGSLDVANYGFGIYGVAAEDWICTDTSEYTATGRGPTGCPDCDWSFTVDISPSVTSGAYCSDFGFSDGDLSTQAWWASDDTKGLGFASEYVFSGTNADYDFENTVFFYYDGASYTGWYWTAYNLPAYEVYSVYGDATYAEIAKAVIVGSGGSYYQYYSFYYL